MYQCIDAPESFDIYMARVQTLMKQLETEEYGPDFALLLHYEHHLTIPKIHEITT